MAPSANNPPPPTPLQLSSSSSLSRYSRRIPGYSHHTSPTSSLFAPCVIPGVTGRDFIPASPPVRPHLYSLRPITPARRQRAYIKAEIEQQQPQSVTGDATMAASSSASASSTLAATTQSRRAPKRRRSDVEHSSEPRPAPPALREIAASPPHSPSASTQNSHQPSPAESSAQEIAQRVLVLQGMMHSDQPRDQSSITVAPLPSIVVNPAPTPPRTTRSSIASSAPVVSSSTTVPITVCDLSGPGPGPSSTSTFTSSGVTSTNKRTARTHLFDAVVAANMPPPTSDTTTDNSSSSTSSSSAPNSANNTTSTAVYHRSITSPDDLERAELVHCFQVLHACGRATQPDQPLSSTRKSIEGFLDAVFKSWTPEGWEAEGAKPMLEFTTEAEVVAGKICAHPSDHKDVVACIAAPDCTADIFARLTYTHSPHSIKMDFHTPPLSSSSSSSSHDSTTSSDTTNKRQQILNPAERNDIRWITATNWATTLREDLHKRVVTRLHKHNKHLAIWQARKMIQHWANGGLPEGAIFTDTESASTPGGSSSGGAKKRKTMMNGGEDLGFFFTSEGAKLAFTLMLMNSAH